MSPRLRWILVWLFALLPLIGWWATGLFDIDEGYYAAVVAEMNRRGEWITPHYNGSPWFEKPILLYWLAKPCIALFGDVVGPRLPSVLATIGLYALTAWFCRRKFTEEVAQLAVLILASSLLVVALGRQMMTDPLLSLALFAAWVFFYLSFEESRKWRWLAGVAVGFGILAKGPVALILFGAVVGWHWFSHRKEPKESFQGGWLGFWVFCIATTALWYLPAYLVNGQTFVQEFLIEQNVGRFTGGDSAHTLEGWAAFVALFAYAVIILLGMLPWSIWVPKALYRAKELGPAPRYLASCTVIPFLFFSVSGAKLPHYILPVFAPLAILVAVSLRSKALPYAMGWCVVIAVAVNVLQSWYYVSSRQVAAHALARYIRTHAKEDQVALFQLSRRENDRGTGSLSLRETGLPSMMLYLDRATIDTDDFPRILEAQGKVWMFTRSGRILPEHFAAAHQKGRELKLLHPPGVTENDYQLFIVEPEYPTGEGQRTDK
ncbi:MAG TPA: glycosyltransferase family 39 protein [Fimbriimonas sp.]|nr:glycosyltransferase family 39 protein [Fimbriimonas sp.]